MLINNVFFHTCDTMCRVVKKIPSLLYNQSLNHYAFPPKQEKHGYGDSKMFGSSTTQQIKHPMLLVKHRPPKSLF
jgi:hypothetical protein